VQPQGPPHLGTQHTYTPLGELGGSLRHHATSLRSSLHSNATHRTLHSHDSPWVQPASYQHHYSTLPLLQSTTATAQRSCCKLSTGDWLLTRIDQASHAANSRNPCNTLHTEYLHTASTAHTGSSCQAVIDCSSLLLALLPHTHTPLHTQHTSSRLNNPLHQSIHPQLVSESAAAAAFKHFSIHGNHGPAKPMNGMNAQTQGGSGATKP
jgi:hypothetical protein